LLSLPTLVKLTDLPANTGHHVAKLGIRLPDFSTEKLQHTMNLPSIPNGKTHRTMQATSNRNLTTREVDIHTHVRNPNQFCADPHTARHTNARSERGLSCHIFKGGNLNPWSMPDSDTAQHAVLPVHRPNGADIPIQALAKALQDAQGRILEVVGHCQDTADAMLRRQPPLDFFALAQLFEQT